MILRTPPNLSFDNLLSIGEDQQQVSSPSSDRHLSEAPTVLGQVSLQVAPAGFFQLCFCENCYKLSLSE